MPPNPDRVRDACEANYAAHTADCSGFVKAVGTALGVTLTGLANDIVATLQTGGDWAPLTDGVAAAKAADSGKFVVAGLRGDAQAVPNVHGHVVVVVAGAPLAHGLYPFAYWGSLGGTPGKNETLNYAWTIQDRDKITYAAHDI
jgi:hypothetical protein